VCRYTAGSVDRRGATNVSSGDRGYGDRRPAHEMDRRTVSVKDAMVSRGGRSDDRYGGRYVMLSTQLTHCWLSASHCLCNLLIQTVTGEVVGVETGEIMFKPTLVIETRPGRTGNRHKIHVVSVPHLLNLPHRIFHLICNLCSYYILYICCFIVGPSRDYHESSSRRGANNVGWGGGGASSGPPSLLGAAGGVPPMVMVAGQ